MSTRVWVSVKGGRGPAHLADLLEDADGVPKVSDVEDGQRELDVRVVTDAVLSGVTASLARRVLLDCALRRRKVSM